MKLSLAVFWFGSLFAPAQATPPAAADTLTFSLDRPAPSLAQYQIQLDRTTGRGFYETKVVASDAGTGASSAGSPTPIVVGLPVLKQMFAAIPAVVHHRCESHNRNLAQTGKKTLTFAHAEAIAACSYNYSDDERVNDATTLFEALGETMNYGQRLAAKLRFDRLGLDTEMEELDTAVKDGRAVELGNIAPVLQAIESDDRVMERVRRRAAHLLEGAGVPSAQAGADAAPSER